MADDEVDVAVVGAGLSGLSAARELRRRGASVVVLEARGRVGGKMHTVDVEGCAVDLGAHWVGPTQRRVLALADELGIQREPQYLDGEHVALIGGRRQAFTGQLPAASRFGVAETALAIARIELRRRLVDADQPWRSRGARRLDSYTLGHWMRGLRSDLARAFFDVTARTVFGAEPSELSFLYVLWYTQAAGGLQALTDFEGGAQDSHLIGGTQQLCERIAAELGDAVVLESPVQMITDGVIVTSARRTVRAGRVIVALSPAVAAQIAFDPPLPADRQAFVQRVPMGSYMKAVAVYDTPWWRKRGLSGLAFGDRPVQMVVDATPPAGQPGVLVAFITGVSARMRPPREAVLQALADMLGAEAQHPTSYIDFNWHEETYSRGGPVGVMGPGTLTSFGPLLRAPLGPLHWAGTETATEWTGYMEGAIQAGERAAREVGYG